MEIDTIQGIGFCLAAFGVFSLCLSMPMNSNKPLIIGGILAIIGFGFLFYGEHLISENRDIIDQKLMDESGGNYVKVNIEKHIYEVYNLNGNCVGKYYIDPVDFKFIKIKSSCEV